MSSLSECKARVKSLMSGVKKAQAEVRVAQAKLGGVKGDLAVWKKKLKYVQESEKRIKALKKK